ncbi:RtcB family protein [Labrys miyagiensis]|uniref:3'-phosphate/5'-hydroxy nucleic acid ligase n=1 Tax=Labrys miyagiensis TaxID=346912 RepID=A0ABQ6CQS0_9HYPH|nr:RNA ligase RtcB family protein [Labrys miyagiensis]GLS21967.1 RtcB family protein [Labrys miyagiensis]
MGNFPEAGAVARIRLFASSNAWIEGAATRQLDQLAGRPDMLAVAGMPDLHPGHHAPVGSAALARGRVFPDVIGTDIGCGMQFWSLDLPERRLKLDKAVERMAVLEGAWEGNAAALLDEHGLPLDFAASLGTVGGGNHFCELQAVEEIFDPATAAQAGVVAGGLSLLVHSGSRGLGPAVLAHHHVDGTGGLPLEGAGMDYLADHDLALRFARLNRQVIAGRALQALRTEGEERIDNPHNLAERQGDLVLHRKGAAPSDRGLVPIPGSRGSVTYLVEPLPAPPDALASLAHGAGRKHDRASMLGGKRQVASNLDRLTRNPYGGHVICTDRQLLLEEAPEAYKDVTKVVADLEAEGLVRVVAILRPVLTFKTARMKREQGRVKR